MWELVLCELREHSVKHGRTRDEISGVSVAASAALERAEQYLGEESNEAGDGHWKRARVVLVGRSAPREQRSEDEEGAWAAWENEHREYSTRRVHRRGAWQNRERGANSERERGEMYIDTLLSLYSVQVQYE